MKFSAEIPWVSVEQYQRTFGVHCEVCGVVGEVPTLGYVNAFANEHREHRAASDHFGLGDAVHRLAAPIARAFGQKPCTPCEARRRQLNGLVRRPW